MNTSPKISAPNTLPSALKKPDTVPIGTQYYCSGAYSLRVTGDCLSSEIRDGELILVYPELPEWGEVGVFWKNDQPLGVKYISGNYLPVTLPIKIKESSVLLSYQVAQINPLKYYWVEVSILTALHRVVGVIELNGSVRSIRPFTYYKDTSEDGPHSS